MTRFNLNGRAVNVDVDPAMPLLWTLRDVVGVTSPKFGCGIAQCGACTVHVNGEAVRSCVYPTSAVAGKRVVTIEGLSRGSEMHPVQKAWVELDVPQCGFCQCGQIMSATALLARTPRPTDAQIDQAMSGNLCRCGTYPRIKAAIKEVAKAMPARPASAGQARPDQARPAPAR